MNVAVTARHFELSPEVRELAVRRVLRIEKYGHALHDAHVVLDVEKYRQIAEVTVRGPHARFVASAETPDMSKSIDSACDKVETQIKKHVDKARQRKGTPENAE